MTFWFFFSSWLSCRNVQALWPQDSLRILYQSLLLVGHPWLLWESCLFIKCPLKVKRPLFQISFFLKLDSIFEHYFGVCICCASVAEWTVGLEIGEQRSCCMGEQDTGLQFLYWWQLYALSSSNFRFLSLKCLVLLLCRFWYVWWFFFFFFCQQVAFQSLQFEGQNGRVYDLSSGALIITHTLFLNAIIPRMVWITKCELKRKCLLNGKMPKFVWKRGFNSERGGWVWGAGDGKEPTAEN